MRGVPNKVMYIREGKKPIFFNTQLECARKLGISKACVHYALKHGNLIKKAKCEPGCLDYQ